MPPVKRPRAKKRAYDTSGRRQAAAQTRLRIAQAARRLFVELGYGATTIAAVAEAAGVSSPTVFAVFGSKRAILMSLLDDMENAADQSGTLSAIAGAAGDARRQLECMVDFACAFFSQGADLVVAVRSAGESDPEFDAIRVEGEARRRRFGRPLVREWARSGSLRKGLSEREAADILWAFGGDLVYKAFVSDQGWPLERYRAWLYATLCTLLFDENL